MIAVPGVPRTGSSGGKVMSRLALICGSALALAAASASAQELRIGFMSTLTGGNAIIGNHQVNGLKLGLEHQGWNKDGDKLGGVATKIFYGDDQAKPDVGLSEAQKMVGNHKVHIIAGNIWSHVLMTVQQYAIENKVGVLSTNAGASPMAGKACSPYFVSTSWNNDQTPEAMGHVMSQEKFKSVWLMAPNYQAGKDMLAGFLRFYKGEGKVTGQTLFKVGETDYQADFSQIAARKPDAVFAFVPGSMGIAFFKQWGASGIGKEIKLYTVFSVDYLTLGPIGEAALGTYHTNYWNPEDPNPVNQKFFKAYLAKFGHRPSHFAAQSYDAPALIAAGVKAVNGKIDDVLALMRAMRKVSYPSVRGSYQYNVNGIPIQNFYLREVVKGPDGKPMIKTVRTVFSNHKDAYWQDCPAQNRF
jgi:branched-chain amino acid transport system substrate-binding protein